MIIMDVCKNATMIDAWWIEAFPSLFSLLLQQQPANYFAS